MTKRDIFTKIYVCGCFVCIHVCVSHVCLELAVRNQALDPLDLELHMVVSHCVSAGQL